MVYKKNVMNTSKIGFDSISKYGAGKSVLFFHEMMQNDFFDLLKCSTVTGSYYWFCLCLLVKRHLFGNFRCSDASLAWKAMVTTVHYHRGRHERKHKNTYLFPLSEMVSTLTLRPIRGGNNSVWLIHKMRVRFCVSYLMETDDIVRFSIFLTALDIIHERSLCFHLNTKKKHVPKAWIKTVSMLYIINY